jgi:hypothetical protein
VLDCETVVDQHGDSAVIRQLASQVGYAPMFNWLNFLSSLVDLAAQGGIYSCNSNARHHWTKGGIYRNTRHTSQESFEYYGDSSKKSGSK